MKAKLMLACLCIFTSSLWSVNNRDQELTEEMNAFYQKKLGQLREQKSEHSSKIFESIQCLMQWLTPKSLIKGILLKIKHEDQTINKKYDRFKKYFYDLTQSDIIESFGIKENYSVDYSPTILSYAILEEFVGEQWVDKNRRLFELILERERNYIVDATRKIRKNQKELCVKLMELKKYKKNK